MRNTRPHVGPPETSTSWEGEDFARVDWDWTELEQVTFVDCRFDDASLGEVVTRRCVPTGVRLDLGHAVQFARAHGAMVEGWRSARRLSCAG